MFYCLNADLKVNVHIKSGDSVMRANKIVYLWIAGISLGGIVGNLPADRFVVEPGTPGVIPGTPYNTWTNASTNIQTAINAAAAGETVWVSNGTYYLNTAISLGTAITLKGLNGASNTFVDGNQATRCVHANHAGCVIDGLTLQNGRDPVYASGIRLEKGTLSNCRVISNTAGLNAGINLGGACTVSCCEIKFNMATNISGGNGGGIGGGAVGSRVENSLIQENFAYDYGGGVYLANGIMSNCTVMANSNSARGGGGIAVYDSAIVQNCRISNNWTKASGGGCRIAGGGVITNSLISSNWANQYGGGAWILAGAANALHGCVISNNNSGVNGSGISADNGGGRAYNCQIVNNHGNYALYSYDSFNVFANCRIMNNTNSGVHTRFYGIFSNCVIAGNSNVGVYMESGGKVRNSLVCNNSRGMVLSTIGTYTGFVDSCTIAGNTYAGGPGGLIISGAIPPQSLTNNIIYGNTLADISAGGAATNAFVNCCANFSSFTPGYGNLTNDPILVNPAAADYRLSRGSPCINAGVNMDWMNSALDMDARRRIRDLAVDMGCYEFIHAGTIIGVH